MTYDKQLWELPKAEPVEEGMKPKKAVSTGSSTEPKRRIGSVRLRRGSKSPHTVAVNVIGVPSKTGTDALKPESTLHTTSEIRVSCRTLDREEQQQEDTAAVWADGTVRIETEDIPPREGPSTNQDAEHEGYSNVLGASGAGMTMERVGTAVQTGQVGNVSDTRNGDGDESSVAHLTNAR